MTREYDLYCDDDDDGVPPPPPPPPTLEVLTQTTCMKFVIRYLDGCSRRRLASTSTFYWRWYKSGFETGQLPKLAEDGRVQQPQKIRKVKLAEQPKNAPQTELAEVDLVRSSSMASQKSATGKFSRGPSSLFKPLSSSSSGKKPISAIKRVFVKRSSSKTSSSSNHVNEMEASLIPIAPSTSVQSTQHHKQSSEHNVVRIPSSSVKSLENHGQPPEANAIESPVTIASSQQPQLGQPHTKAVSHLSDSQKASLSSVDTNSSMHAHPPKNKHNHENETNMMKREECNHTGNTQMMRKLPSLLGFSHSRSFEENDEEPFDQMEPTLIRNLSSTTAANVAHPSKAPNREAVSSSQPSKPALILGSPTRGSSFDAGIGAGSPPRLSLSHDTRNKSLRDDHGKEWFHRHHNDEVEGDDTTTPSESESESTSFSSRPSLLLGATGRLKSKPASMTPVVVTPPRSHRAGLGNLNGGRDSVSFGIDRVGSRDGSRSRSRNGYRNGNQHLFRDDDSPSDDSEQEEEVDDDLSREDRYRRHQREHGRQSEQRELRHVKERRPSREPTTRRETAIQPDQNTRPSDTPDMLQQLADAALFNAPLILTEAPVVFSNYMNGLIEKTRVPQKGNGLNAFAGVDGRVAHAGIVGFATNGNSRGHGSGDGKESNNNERDNGRNHSNKENKHVVTKPTLKEAVPNRRNSEALTEIEKVESMPKESRTKKALPRGNQAATPDFIQQLTDAALFEAPTVVSKYINGIFGLAGDKDSNENIEEEEEEETIDSLILKGFQNYGEHDPVSSEVTLEEMIFSGFTRGLNVVPRMEITEVMTEEDIDEKIMSGLVKGKIIDLAVEKYYSQNDENQDVDDQGPIQIGNKLYTHEEARQIWLRARKRSGEVASEESIPKEKETLKEAILAQLIGERLREYKRVNEEKYGGLGFDGSTEKELEDGGDAGSYKYAFGLRRRRFFDENGMRRSLSPIEGRYGDGDVEGNGYANRAGVGNDDGYGKRLFTNTNKNATSVNNNGIANNSLNINGRTNAHGDGTSSGGYYSNKTGARKSSVRFQEEEAPVPNANDASTPRQTNNNKSPTGPVSLDRLITDFENKKDATKYDDETTEVANNARRHIAMNSVSSDIPTKKLFREVTESEDVSAKDSTVYNSLSTFRQRQEAIIEEIIRKTYVEETPKIENKTLPSPPISFIEEANTTTMHSSPAKDSVLGSNYGVEVSSIPGTNLKFVNNSKIGVTTRGGESFLGSQFGTEVVVKPEKLVTERKPRTLASHNMNVRGSMSKLSVKGFGGVRQNAEGGKTKGAETNEKSTLPPPISEVKVKTRKTNPLKKLGIKKSSKS